MNQLKEKLPSMHRPNSGIFVIVLRVENCPPACESLLREATRELRHQVTLALSPVLKEQDAVEWISDSKVLVFLPPNTCFEYVAPLADRVLETLKMLRTDKGETIQLAASAALEFFGSRGEAFKAHLHQAAALPRIPQGQRAGIHTIYSASGGAQVRAIRNQAADLRRAIDREELCIQYQPQYEIRGGNCCGVEALARWTLPDGKTVPPARFILQAEQTGQIAALGAWILSEACQTVGSWSSLAQPPILCVNISAYQICHQFTATLAAALERSGFPAARLELEITESVLIANPDLALECLADLKALGVRIAIDDFGSGYSSLSYLSRLPVDRLKIDRSLIQRIVTDKKTAAIVRAIVRLGADFGFAVLAEGVETEEQFAVLSTLRCSQVQGYLLAKPADALDAEALMQRKWGARFMTATAQPRSAKANSYAI